MTIIIAASTGTGKSTAAKNSGGRILDSDSDYFRHDRRFTPKSQRPEWPQNFIDHPVEEVAAGTFEAVLISAYEMTEDGVLVLKPIYTQVPITLVYPRLDMKGEMEARYRRRGNKGELLNKLLINFERWNEGLMAIDHPNVTHRVLQPGQYLAHVLHDILDADKSPL